MLAVEAGEVCICASLRSSSGQLRKNMRTLTGVATSTAAMLSRDSSWPEGAGRSRLGPNTVARLLRFILLCSELAEILVCVCGWVGACVCVCVRVCYREYSYMIVHVHVYIHVHCKCSSTF